MQVNREWWDGTTHDFTNRQDTIVTVLDDSIWTKVQANPEKYIGQKWDKSICPWKINYESDLFKTMWMLPYANLENQFTLAAAPFYKERKKGYTFYLSCNGNTSSGNRPSNSSNPATLCPVWLGTLSRPDTDITDTVQAAWLSTKAGDIKPVINFDYSKIFVVPMIYNMSHVGTLFSSSLEESWDPTDISALGFVFYQVGQYGSAEPVAMSVISLNNDIVSPTWSTTDAWNEDEMFDNTLALQRYTSWDGGLQISSYESIGSHVQTGNTSVGGVNYPGNGFKYDNPKLASDDAAGSVYYIPNKAINTVMPTAESDMWESEFTSYYIGGQYGFGIHRHLKSTVTYQQFYDYAAKQCAYLGFRFCMDGNHRNDGVDSEYFYLPEIDSKGVTTGNYYQANSTEAQALPNNNWTNDVYQQTPYDGTDDEEEDDPNDYDEDLTTVINHYKGITVDSTLEYLMTSHALTEFIGALGSWVTEANEESLKHNFGTTDPQKLIISVIAYPVDLSDGGWAGQEQVGGGINGITFPNAETEYHPHGSWPNYFPIGKIGIPIKRNAMSPAIDDRKDMYLNDNEIIEINRRTSSTIYPVKTLNYYNKNKNFLDYGPYSSAVLQVPYCGSIDISPDDFIGENINCKYIIAPSEGTVKVLVERNDLMVDTLTGTIGVPVDLNGTDVSAKLNAIHQANATIQAQRQKMYSSIATFAAGAAITVGTGGSAAPVIMAGLGLASQNQSAKRAIEEANYQIDTAEAPFHQIQAGHGELALTDQAGVRLVIHRPKFLEGYNPEVYGHTVGFATLINSQLKSYHGFTTVNTVDLTGVNCTEEEAQMIKGALKAGVYLP